MYCAIKAIEKDDKYEMKCEFSYDINEEVAAISVFNNKNKNIIAVTQTNTLLIIEPYNEKDPINEIVKVSETLGQITCFHANELNDV